MKVNGESIYGAAACPFATAPAWGRVTQKPGKLYLHVFDWPANGKLTLPALNGRKPASAHLLADPKRAALADGDDHRRRRVDAPLADASSVALGNRVGVRKVNAASA